MKIFTSILFVLLLFNGANVYSQGEDKFVTFTGFVIDSQTDQPLPGTYVINERAGKGTSTNGKGYFSISVFPGDSISFRFLGYKKQYYIIPRDVDIVFSAVVELQEDSKMLREVKVYPFKSEKEFKEALVNMQLPDAKAREALERNLGHDRMVNLVASQAMGSEQSFRTVMDMQQTQFSKQYTAPILSITDPMAWVNFIKGIKSGQYKQKTTNTYNPNYGNNNRDYIIKNGD